MEFNSTLTPEILAFSLISVALIATATYYYMKNFTNAKTLDDIIGKIF